MKKKFRNAPIYEYIIKGYMDDDAIVKFLSEFPEEICTVHSLFGINNGVIQKLLLCGSSIIKNYKAFSYLLIIAQNQHKSIDLKTCKRLFIQIRNYDDIEMLRLLCDMCNKKDIVEFRNFLSNAKMTLDKDCELLQWF